MADDNEFELSPLQSRNFGERSTTVAREVGLCMGLSRNKETLCCAGGYQIERPKQREDMIMTGN